MYVCMHYECMYVCTCVCIDVCMYVCPYVCMYVRMYECMHVCVICVYVCVYACMRSISMKFVSHFCKHLVWKTILATSFFLQMKRIVYPTHHEADQLFPKTFFKVLILQCIYLVNHCPNKITTLTKGKQKLKTAISIQNATGPRHKKRSSSVNPVAITELYEVQTFEV